MARDDCVDLRRTFERADAELRAGIDRLIPVGEPDEEREFGRVIGDAVLYPLAELARVRRQAWDAYMDCVRSSRAVHQRP